MVDGLALIAPLSMMKYCSTMPDLGTMGQADPFGRGHVRISDGRAWGLILHEVFGTFLARPKGLLISYPFLSG
jgi:hypothetical protein